MAEEYRQRLDNNVEKLVENFKGLIKTAKVKDKTNTTRESFQNSIYATTLVRSRHCFHCWMLIACLTSKRRTGAGKRVTAQAGRGDEALAGARGFRRHEPDGGCHHGGSVQAVSGSMLV